MIYVRSSWVGTLAVVLGSWLVLPPARAVDIQVSTGVSATDTASCGVGVNPSCRTVGYAIGTRADGCPVADKVLLADGTYDTANGDLFPIGLKDCVSVIGNTGSPSSVVVDANDGTNGNDVFNASGPLTQSTISGMTIRPGAATNTITTTFGTFTTTTAGDGIQIDDLYGFDAVTAVIELNSFDGGGRGVAAFNDDDSGNAVNLSPTIRYNSFAGQRFGAVAFYASESGLLQVMAPLISSNAMSSVGTTSGVDAIKVSATSDAEGLVAPIVVGNFITNPGGDGMSLAASDLENGDNIMTFRPLVVGNTITGAGDDGIYVAATSFTSTATSVILAFQPIIVGNTITGPVDDGVDMEVSEISDSATSIIVLADMLIGGNTIASPGDRGVELSVSSLSDMEDARLLVSATVSGNTITSPGGDGILVSFSSWSEMDRATVSPQATISNNTVTGSTGGDGIHFIASNWSSIASSAGSLTALPVAISNNTVTGNAGAGIIAEALDINNSAVGFEFNPTISNNTVSGNQSANSGIEVRYTDSGAEGTALVLNNDVSGNTGTGVLIDLVGASGPAGGLVGVALRSNTITGNSGNAIGIDATSVTTATNYAIDLGGGFYNGGSNGNNKIKGNSGGIFGNCIGGAYCDIENIGVNNVSAVCNQFTSSDVTPGTGVEEGYLYDDDDWALLGDVTPISYCVVACDTDNDCDDGLACTGTETCDPLDPLAGPDGCVAGTAVDCDDSISCTTDTCNEPTGTCTNTEVNAACDDGIGCTTDTCSDVSGCDNAPNDAACDDGVGCTDDTCSVIIGCVNATNDGNCDDADVCTDNVCDATLDCQYPFNSDPCDDGVNCTVNDTCDGAGTCAGTTDDSLCDDSELCTDDTCTLAGCTNTNNAAPCDDGVFCNGADTCDSGSCSLHAGDPCVPGTTCAHTCNEAALNCNEPDCTACNDGNAGTLNDRCHSGVCFGRIGPANLGQAKTFSVLGINSTSIQLTGLSPTTVTGNICTWKSSFGKNSVLGGKVIATKTTGGAVSFGGACSVANGIYTGGGSVSPGAPAVINPVGTFIAPDPTAAAQVSLCATAATTAKAAADIIADPLACGSVNTTMTGILVPANGTQTLAVTPGQLNLIRLGNLQVDARGTLIISAASNPGTAVVINVTGTFRVARLGKIKVSGVLPNQVLINVQGAGGTATVEQEAQLEATLLATERDISLGSKGVARGGLMGGATAIGIGPGALVDKKIYNRPLP
ncbi:MAG: right-handed parallel beta-helix repeat-containing protein [Deltaproteobacteria bacterium]|nr:right-handed parallel beta-helix repeat-containing protein [Deltaproteobacteria bacterium]